MKDSIVQNPYEILEVSHLASNAEITKAFAMAMKARKYPPDAIAKARKSLMNPDERIIADYLSPIITTVKRFKASIGGTVNSSESELKIDRLDELIEIEIQHLDREEDLNLELANLVWES